MKLGTHAVKVRGPLDKRWDFVSGNGYTTHLRIHAATMDEHVATRVAQEISDNTEFLAKVVKL